MALQQSVYLNILYTLIIVFFRCEIMGAAQSVQTAESITTKSSPTDAVSPAMAACPVNHKSVRHAAASGGAGCPVDHQKIAAGKGMDEISSKMISSSTPELVHGIYCCVRLSA